MNFVVHEKLKILTAFSSFVATESCLEVRKSTAKGTVYYQQNRTSQEKMCHFAIS